MTNNEFKDRIDELLKPLGFRKQGNYWRLETNEIEKIVNLQKSNFSNLYYVNYGFNLKKLDFDGVLMHIFNRLNQSNAFDLENNLDSSERRNKISKIIEEELIPNINRIANESDVFEYNTGYHRNFYGFGLFKIRQKT